MLSHQLPRIVEAGLVTAVPPFASLVKVQDKVLARSTLEKLGIAQPQSVVVHDMSELASWTIFPAYVKAPIGTGSTGVTRVVDAAGLAAAFSRRPRDGDNYGAWLLWTRSVQRQLEALVGGLETQAGIEAMRVGPCVVGGELHAVAPETSRPVNGGAHEDPADPPATPVRMHVHRLDLGAQPALRLQVAEDDELADTHHLARHLGHQDVAETRRDLIQGSAVLRQSRRIFLPLDLRPVLEELHDAWKVPFRCGPDGNLTRAVVRAHRASASTPPL